MKTWVVYTYRYPSGAPAYVGYTGNLANRMKHHRYRSDWWRPDLTCTHEVMASRSHAQLIEARTIRALQPVHNDRFRDVPALRGRPALGAT